MTRREQITQALLSGRSGQVGLETMIKRTGLTEKQVLRDMDKLVAEGLVAESKSKKYQKVKTGVASRNPVWKIVDREGLKKRKETKRRPGSVRDRIWKAVRISRIFQKRDIEKLSGQAFSACDDYICVLVRNGYARCTGRDKRGAFYQLIKDPGPKRPMISDIPES